MTKYEVYINVNKNCVELSKIIRECDNLNNEEREEMLKKLSDISFGANKMLACN